MPRVEGGQLHGMTARSFILTFTLTLTLARLRWRREVFLKPRFPERSLACGGSGRPIAVEVEVHRNHARAAAVESARVRRCPVPACRAAAEHRMDSGRDVLHHAAQRWDPRRGARWNRPALPWLLTPFSPNAAGQRFPGLRFRTRGRGPSTASTPSCGPRKCVR